jgi:hypothetical protein
VVFVERWISLAVRYRLPRGQRVKGPSIGLVRDLLLRRSFLFAHFFAFGPSSTMLWASLLSFLSAIATSRRIASAMLGRSACDFAQALIGF